MNRNFTNLGNGLEVSYSVHLESMPIQLYVRIDNKVRTMFVTDIRDECIKRKIPVPTQIISLI